MQIDLNKHCHLKYALTGLAGIGAYYMTLNLLSALKGFWKYCLLWRKNLKDRYGGGWALVTGASDGIGK